MRFGVLGPLAVWTADGEPVPVPGAKVRALLARLLVDPGRPVSVDRLVDDLWSATALPDHPGNALQGKVSQLRRVLERAGGAGGTGEAGRGERGGRGLVESGPAGYRLRIAADAVDAGRFSALLARARAAADPAARAGLLSEALGMWRGEAFADFADEPFVRAAVTRLEEERLAAWEEQAAARLELGEHAAVAGELAAAVARHPLRERLRAVRMRALYRAGRQTEALDCYEEVRRLLADELGLEPGAELVALHRAILRQDPALDAPAAPPAPPALTASPAPAAPVPITAPAPPVPKPTAPAAPAPAARPRPRGNLPAPVAGLVGRETALAEVRELLRASRLVTLSGPGGVGKTRLALEVARAAAEAFPEGVWLTELAPLEATRRPEAVGAVAEAVMTALDIREDVGADAPGAGPPTPARPPVPPLERLTAALRDRRLLLVLDNCEHLVEAVAELAEALLPRAAGLTVLATSQEPLGLSGERVWPVPPLDLPDASAAGDRAALERSSAARLFLARAALPGLTLDAAGAEAVAALCRRLDGIPLALELAASRVRTLGVHGLLARLDDRFALLAGGFRDAPARQRTLRATIDWSWGLLSPAERVVLRRLAVHAEGCAPEAAEATCAGDGVRPAEVLDLLSRLVDRSLVVLSDRASGPRYRLLESVRDYCLERLREAGELTAVRERHSRHYAVLAERAARLLRGPGQREWLERLDAEGANLRRALDFAVRRASEAEADTGSHGAPCGPRAARRALRMVNALAWYWMLRGRLAEAHRSLSAALDAARIAAEDEAERAAEEEALAMAWQAGIALMRGDAEAGGAERIRAALAAYDGVDDPPGRATALWILGSAQMGAGDVATGERLVDQAMAAFRALGDDWGTAASASIRARHALAHGDLAAVRREGELSARLFARIGDDWGRLQAVFPLASLAEITGDYRRATRLHQDGLAIAERLGLWTEASKRLSGLGRLALLDGDPARAEEYHRRARKLAGEQNFRPGEVNAEIGLALGARRAGRLDEAAARMRDLLDWFREVDYGPGTTLALAELGFLAELRGDAAAARALHLEGFAVARRLGDPRALALALEGLAGAEVAAGRHGGAAVLLGAATAARESVGAPLPAAERGDVDRIGAAARAALGEADFAGNLARGAELTPERAVGVVSAAVPDAPGAVVGPDGW
ncbi:AfsR/SARP family transcriptional regulator [Allostreptomyces psammosilenae]|uniref:Putative ATPase/DNA-binding SARP family transcriptional activator n=1 Tax=Allostreptomyces psammosilenae TaxID=1892865 RepID=A0A853A490_9ACTN|nr:BTAD domain-containing putative transcriptional regulator [Allostreptomyces psammosilenae]NYI05521.1 putative ATPase/DNA-binding SARP family transcriptional activator [Allostreptomyces psammosilenae]